MSTFITRIDDTGPGLRLAVKDLIDLEGLPTTAACRAVADSAGPARSDAVCMAGAREAQRAGELRIVGKVNLHELAFGASGVNPSFGTPVNPVDPHRVPGGSSSGSAVAVGSDVADIAFGTDTGGSVRIPSACCGTAGMKTTYGRISIEGVWPLAPSFDTVGPMARDVEGVVAAMRLLEPGFEPAEASPVVGRFRPEGVDPAIDAAVDRALSNAELEVVEVRLPGWRNAGVSGGILLLAEAWAEIGHLLERRELIGPATAARIEAGRQVDADAVASAEEERARWIAELDEVLGRVTAIALPTIAGVPPGLDIEDDSSLAALTMPVNIAGLPAFAQPVPAGRFHASLQLVGPRGGEEKLATLARRIESAVG